MITLYLGRHGETVLNAQNKLRGWIDTPLNEKGLQEAQKMATMMEGVKLDKIYSSNLIRAERTARIIAQSQEIKKPIARQWFRPINYGDLNGKPIDEVKPVLLELNKTWVIDPDYQIPNGESFTEFQNRNWDGLITIMDHAENDTNILIVAHLRNMLLFRGIATTGGPLKGQDIHWMDGTKWTQDSGSISQYSWHDGQLLFEKIIGGQKTGHEEAVS